jgi:hypothetical protein
MRASSLWLTSAWCAAQLAASRAVSWRPAVTLAALSHPEPIRCAVATPTRRRLLLLLLLLQAAWAPLRGPDRAVTWNIGEEHDPRHNTPSYMPEFTIANIKDADQIEEESFSYSDTAEGQFIMYSCRWRGMFLEEFELQDFPLDMQEYSLRIEAMSNGFFTDHKGRCDERHRKTVLKPVSQCPAAFLRRNPVSLCRGDAMRSTLQTGDYAHASSLGYRPYSTLLTAGVCVCLCVSPVDRCVAFACEEHLHVLEL